MQFPKFILNLWRIEQNELITKTLHAANTSYLSKHNANIRHSKLIKCQNSTYLQKKRNPPIQTIHISQDFRQSRLL